MPYADGNANGNNIFKKTVKRKSVKVTRLLPTSHQEILRTYKKRVNDDDFTGGANLDKRIEEQRRIKKMMKNKKGKA